MFGALKQDLGTIGILTLPADNGTWSVTLTASSKDAELRALRHPETWERVNRLLPLTAHWIDAEPLDDSVTVMAKIEDRIRDFAPGGDPVATGVVAVADSWSCTNPSLGRGATIGLMHATVLRDQLRQPEADPWTLATGWYQQSRAIVEPWYRATKAYDSHRLQEIQTLMEGHPYETDDEFWLLNRGLEEAALRDGDNIRAVLDMGMALRRPDEVLGDGSLRERILGQDRPDATEPGMAPDREQLLGRAERLKKRSVGSMRVDSSGVNLNVEISGPDDGRAVLLLHGFPDSGRLWSSQAGALSSAGYRVIVPDQRGYGQSDKPAEVDAYNIILLAADVAAILDQVGVEKAAIVGHDWGAAVALDRGLAGARPRRQARRTLRWPPARLWCGRPRATREVVVHASVPVRGDRRGMAFRERLGQLPLLGRPPRCGCGHRRPRVQRVADPWAQLVPGQRPPAHPDRATAGAPTRHGADTRRVELR